MEHRILVVDDEVEPREAVRRLLEAWGYQADTAGSVDEAFSVIERATPAAVITDLVMPGQDGLDLIRRLRSDYPVPVIVFTARGSRAQAVEAMRLGAQHVLEKPVDANSLRTLVEYLAGQWEQRVEIRRLRAELREHGVFGPLRGVSDRMKAVYRQIQQVAPSDLSVLVEGESGTGKELVAQTLHQLSPRRRNEFVPLNCAAIPATLLESEIFGHEKGAFTGAVQRKIGCFEMADRGSLFFDEIAELDENLQAKLLRVLQEQKFRRVGGRELIKADVRVIAATNRDPKRAMEEGKLRHDLYYRLNGFTISLPPLRDRREDVPPLARHFAERYAARTGTDVPAFDQHAVEMLVAHHWPGNVRELRNAVERAALLSGGKAIRTEHLPPEVFASGPDPSHAVPASDDGAVVVLPVGSTMEDAEREMIRSTLAQTTGNKTRAAKILGISLKTMHNKVKKYRL